MNRRDCLQYGGMFSIHALINSQQLNSQSAVTTKTAKTMRAQQLIATTPTLQIAYEESGHSSGSPVVLLHGFPYDARQYDTVRNELATSGHRVLVPYLRGFGATQYREQRTYRSGQQAALGKDIVDFLDALQIPRAILVGYDWGGRAACVAAAIWPERVRGLVSCGGYTIHDIAKNVSRPAPPPEVYARWYVSYFNMNIGRIGLEQDRNGFCRFLWKLWSPTWRFTEEEYQRTALSFGNPDFVSTVIQEYRHRMGNAPGDPALAKIEEHLATQPVITVSTVVLSGQVDAVEPPPTTDPHRDRFTGPYERRILSQIGHCVPAEAPQEVAAAVSSLLSA